MSQLSVDYSSLSEEDSIEELHLRNRSINALRDARIGTVGEVRQLLESGQLRTVRGLGRKCILEIKESLAQVKIHDVSEVEAPKYITPDRNTVSISREDPIEKLDLSVRSYNALTGAGIQTVGEVLQLVDTGRLRLIPALGRKSISEIEDELIKMETSDALGNGVHIDTTLNENYILLSRKRPD